MITVKSNTSKTEKLQSLITISLISLITQKLYGLFHKNSFSKLFFNFNFLGSSKHLKYGCWNGAKFSLFYSMCSVLSYSYSVMFLFIFSQHIYIQSHLIYIQSAYICSVSPCLYSVSLYAFDLILFIFSQHIYSLSSYMFSLKLYFQIICSVLMIYIQPHLTCIQSGPIYSVSSYLLRIWFLAYNLFVFVYTFRWTSSEFF